MATPNENARDDALLIPMKLDVFAIGDPKAYAEQCPNVTLLPTNIFDYSRLRLRKQTLEADLQDHADFESAKAPKANPRLFNPTTAKPRPGISGVYISWTLPQIYRSESASTQQTTFTPAQVPPNRWMVARITRNKTTHAGWVIESDVYRHIDSLDPSIDLTTDVSQYVQADLTNPRAIDSQGEHFLGEKRNLKDWKERDDRSILRVKPIQANGAGNLLFADYQPHNPNVFSLHDPLDGVPVGTQIGYSVVGWHADVKEDPFMTKAANVTNGQLLSQFSLVLDQTKMHQDNVKKWKTSTSPTRHICHGSTYTLLTWNPSPTFPSQRHPSISSDAEAAILRAKGSVSVGADPFDAFGAFMHSAGADQSFQDFQKLQNIAVSGSYNAHLDQQSWAEEFQRLLREFKIADGGSYWKVQPSSENPVVTRKKGPTIILNDTEKEVLQDLNTLQWAFDHLGSTLDYKRWELFCQWWRCVTKDNQTDTDEILIDHSDLVNQIYSLSNARNKLEDGMKLKKDLLPPLAKVPSSPFMKRKDPTVALLGCKSPWPDSFSNGQIARLRSQCIIDFDANRFGSDAYFDAVDMAEKLVSIPISAMAVHGEHCGYMAVSCGDKMPHLKENQVAPPYCNAIYNRDAIVDSQLVPLYIEWEAEYCHVPYNLWEPSHSRSSQTQTYPELTQTLTTASDISKLESKFPRRTLGGRALLHPGPGHSLANILRNSVARMPESILKDTLAVNERDSLYKKLEAIPSLSCRLDGFVDQLVTLISGTTHIRPTLPDGRIMPEALQAGKRIGFTEKTLKLVENNCDPLPYGDGIDREAPFIPVTHGQVKFRKLNVIDKFGRGVDIVGNKGVMPSFSSIFKPSIRGDGGDKVPNVIAHDGDECQFFEIAPSINQPARLYNSYVKPGNNTRGTWVSCNEWDDPVCGYILYNSVDLSLQIFTSTGEFYAEVLTSEGNNNNKDRVARFGTPPETQTPGWSGRLGSSEEWKQTILDKYIKCLKVTSYALRMIEILGDASSCCAPPSESYSAIMNSAFGRPFALAVAAWSIELSHEALKPQTSLGKRAGTVYSKLSDYDFPLKLGLKEYSDDGLAAYFPMQKNDISVPDFRKVCTFWPSGETAIDQNDDFDCYMIQDSNLPTLKAHHVDSFNENATVRSVEDMMKERHEQILPFCLLVDVFHPIKAQTGVLPPSNLSLPEWSVQQALRSIQVFYRAGPFLWPIDPAVMLQVDVASTEETHSIHVPTIPYGKWSWLQPYISGDDVQYRSYNVNKTGDPGSTLANAKYPFTMADGMMRSTEPLLHRETTD